MADNATRSRTIVDQNTKPALPRHIKLRHDKGRDRWIILAPERVLAPDAVSVAILQKCDGSRNIEEISQELARDYTAPIDEIRRDVIDYVQDMSDRGYMHCES